MCLYSTLYSNISFTVAQNLANIYEINLFPIRSIYVFTKSKAFENHKYQFNFLIMKWKEEFPAASLQLKELPWCLRLL